MQTDSKEIERIYYNDVKKLRKVFKKSKSHIYEIKHRVEFLKELKSIIPYKHRDCDLYTNGFTYITSNYLDKKEIDTIMKIAANYKNYRIEAHPNGRTMGITFLVRNNIDYGF
jgi:hypothetical protein